MSKIRKCPDCKRILEEREDVYFKTSSMWCPMCKLRKVYWLIIKTV